MDERTERRAEAAYAEFRRTRGPRAIAAVFDLVAAELLLLARRLARDAAAAEDLVQQTFVRAIERAEQFDPSRRLLPWLTTILANEARMLHRRPEPDAARLRPAEVAEPPQEAARREAKVAMDAAFAGLSAEYRDVVAMRHLHGMAPRQIAKALDVPVATVKTRLRRGLERLAATLPPGLAFGAAVALLAGRGMAATRGAVLARTGGLGAAAALVSFGGGVTMKKIAIVLAAALALLVSRPLWWKSEPALVDAAGGASAASVALDRAAADPAAATEPVSRSPVADLAPPPAATATEELVAIDVLVNAVWKRSRKPAARVPLELLVQGSERLASQWTDHAGAAHFVLHAAPRHWLAGSAERQVSVTTPLAPFAFYNLALTASPGTLEVELDDGESIAGLVVDAAGNPVPGADVRLTTPLWADAVVARSDAAGGFELVGLPPGFVLRASAGTMESEPTNIASLAAGERLVLRLDRGGDLVQIRVVAGGAALAEATVRLDTGRRAAAPQRQLLGSTNGEGVATFAGLPADAYVVEVVHRAHPPAQRRITTEGLGLTRIETVELGEAATLVGIVRCGGKPAAAIRVHFGGADSLLYRSEFRTDRDGRFTVDQLPVGHHELAFARDNGWESRRVTLRAGEQTVEFELPGGTDIAGRLLLPDGTPATQWQVVVQRADELVPSRRAIATDAEGRFAFANLARMSYRLAATGAEGGRHTFFAVRTDGAAADYRLPAAALWSGEGHHSVGNGLAADGTFTLSALAPGRHRVWLEHDDVPLWVTELELVSGQALDLGVVSLPRCGALIVAVRGATGVDVPNAAVRLRAAIATAGDDIGPRPRLGTDGAWHCERVPPGEWWLTVAGDGIAPDVRKIVVEPDSTQRIEVELAPAVAVEVHYAVGKADARTVGWRRETVRRVSDGAIVHSGGSVGDLRSSFDLARGSYTIEVETGGGFLGLATFDAPAPAPVALPLARR